MSTFTALNVEPEDTVEEEIDDTKEIQIEEALKLYQSALKLHSQGPSYYPAAEEAYRELFQSEVFKYPEAISGYIQDQLDEAVSAETLPNETETLPLVQNTSADSAANSLPQLVYLAYKSRAQFVLDLAHHELQQTDLDRKDLCQYYRSYCLQSLDDSAKALDRDDTDLDLWKKTARISDVLSTHRVARFCLESVLAGDDEGGDQAIDLSGLDEAYASGQLEQVMDLVGDDLFRPATTSVRPKHKLLEALRQSNDAYPFLPRRSQKLEYLSEHHRPNHFIPERIVIRPTDQTRISLGQALLQALRDHELATSGKPVGGNVHVTLPEIPSSRPAKGNDTTMSGKNVPKESLNEPQVVDKMLDNAQHDSPSSSVKSPASFHSAPDVIDQEVTAIKIEEREQPKQSPEKDERPPLQEPRLPTRKRSSTAAGMEESESRIKSKRLRARESMLELAAQDEDVAQEVNPYDRELLAIIEDADEIAVGFLDKLLSKIGVSGFGPPAEIRATFWQEEAIAQTPVIPAVQQRVETLLTDMRHALFSWTDEKSAAIISGRGSRETVESSGGLGVFLRHLRTEFPQPTGSTTSAKEDDVVTTFAEVLENTPTTIYEAAFIWLLTLTTTKYLTGNLQSSYTSEKWPEELKQQVVDIAVEADEQLFDMSRRELGLFNSNIESAASSLFSGNQVSNKRITDFVQSMFEIHLDIYTSYTAPESLISEDQRIQQFECLQRWARLATDSIQIHLPSNSAHEEVDKLILRFLWASVKIASIGAGDDKSHILVCLQDLRVLLNKAGDPAITLPNNVTMPQISISAVDQEVSRLTTLDFFVSIFDSDQSDPVMVITKLEPILEPNSGNTGNTNHDQVEGVGSDSRQIEELQAFLDSGDASLRLLLWRKLQNAYTAISYSPKVVSCLLRSFEIIATEIQTQRHAELDTNLRQITMFHWLRDADDIITKILNKVMDETKAFEVLDQQHLISSMEAILFMLRLLHGFVLFDDSIRIGQNSVPALRPSSLKLFEKSRDRLRDAYVRLWTLLFYLLKEATIQFSARFECPAEQLAEYLRNVHNAFGYRQYCKNCNKLFIKLTKTELLALRSDVDYSQDLAQILYDMYQIKFGVGIGDADHGCTPELLRDKATAMTLVPIIMTYAVRLNMRDLIKSELKGTIEKIQQCLGSVKTSSALSFNKKVISAFLKSQINPQAVYRSLNGLGDLTIKPVQGDYAKIAATGWYLLLGKMSLAKFKSIKRVNPTATDDLDTAATFLRHDLEHNITGWETWYRLAQVLDTKIEDSLIWNATKLNDSRGEIATLERNAINAYTMAIAMAMRSADDNDDTVQKISDMFAEFAFRLYASSRPPLDMEAFKTDKVMRHISNSIDQTMSKVPFVQPFRLYSVWSFAVYLLRRKLKASTKEWFCHYTLGKCLWKMFQSKDNQTARHPVVIEEVLEAITDAIELVPKKEKSTEYILEPHYKLVSIVHKLVSRNLIEKSKGIEYLLVTRFAKGAPLSEDEQGQIEWEPYILDVLKRIGQADKSNWHHRITARAAHVTYDDDPNMAGALGARHQFTQQIFTKTMTMQVWKPEHERPGRHYVYTGRYLSFFVHLLDQLSDRDNLEQLVRRIRRKTTDFLDHPKVWEQTATTYLRLLRRVAKIPEGRERAVFDKITYESFAKMAERVEKWAHEQETTSIYLSTITDAIELKKLNNSLMKGPAIDDLIGDSYACMYEAFVEQLPPEETPIPTRVGLSQATFINLTSESVPLGDDNLDRMRLNNLLSAQVDGGYSSKPGSISGPSGTPPRATPDPGRVPTPNKPGRVKTITKREIQRKAEAASNRPQSAKTPTLSKRLVVEVPKMRREGSTANDVHNEGDEDAEQVKDKQASDAGVDSRRPSVVGSPRNSEGPDGNEDNENEADDESELSEVEDEDDEDADSKQDPSPGQQGKKRKAEDEVDGGGGGDQDDASSDGDEEDNEEGQDDDNDNSEEEGDEDDDGDGDGDAGQENPEAEVEDTMDVDDENEDAVEIQDSQEQRDAETKT